MNNVISLITFFDFAVQLVSTGFLPLGSLVLTCEIAMVAIVSSKQCKLCILCGSSCQYSMYAHMHTKIHSAKQKKQKHKLLDFAFSSCSQMLRVRKGLPES